MLYQLEHTKVSLITRDSEHMDYHECYWTKVVTWADVRDCAIIIGGGWKMSFM